DIDGVVGNRNRCNGNHAATRMRRRERKPKQAREHLFQHYFALLQSGPKCFEFLSSLVGCPLRGCTERCSSCICSRVLSFLEKATSSDLEIWACNCCNQAWVLKNSGHAARFSPYACRVIRFFVSSWCVQAVAISGAGLQLRNRTSRLRFCTVAAR